MLTLIQKVKLTLYPKKLPYYYYFLKLEQFFETIFKSHYIF